MNYETKKCETFCPNNGYKDSTSHECIKCTDTYNTGCSKCNNIKCIICSLNYLHPTSNKCETTCPIGYFANENQNTCNNCETIFNIGCQECNSTSCIKCNRNYLNLETK